MDQSIGYLWPMAGLEHFLLSFLEFFSIVFIFVFFRLLRYSQCIIVLGRLLYLELMLLFSDWNVICNLCQLFLFFNLIFVIREDIILIC